MNNSNNYFEDPPDHNAAWKFFSSRVRWAENESTPILERNSHGLFKKKINTIIQVRRHSLTRTSSNPIENNGKPIPIWESNLHDLGIFGVGIQLYFKQILCFFWICLIYGVLLAPYSAYLFSSNFASLEEQASETLLERTSAICFSYQPVNVTVDCDPSQQNCIGRSARSCVLPGKSSGPYFKYVAFLDIFAMTILFVFCIYQRCLHKKEVEEIDVSQQTTQDYSIVVHDPNGKDDDPDKWKDFFEKFGEVAYVTVARANSSFLKALTERRQIECTLNLQCNPFSVNESFQNSVCSSTQNSPKRPPFWVWSGEEFWQFKLWNINQRIQKLMQKKFPVCKVYVTFKTEEGQRNALKTLSTGRVSAQFDIGRLGKSDRFDGTNVLDIHEADEPTDVIWHNLAQSRISFQFQRFYGYLLTMGIVAVFYFFLKFLKKIKQVRLLGPVIAVLNFLLPTLLRFLTFGLEAHSSEGSREDSLFNKLVIARIMNTSLINFFATPFSNFLGKGFITSIQSILISDAIISPTLDLLDIGGMIRRRILARGARTHRELLSYFTGSPWNLGERYTKMINTFFLAVMYAPLLPPGLFIAAFCFAYSYWVNKYLLLRKWKKPPQYDAKLALQAQRHVMLSLVVHALVTLYWYYGWPFDNTSLSVQGYKFQDKRACAIGNPLTWYKLFCTVPQTWQDPSQQLLVYGYGWFCPIVLGTYMFVHVVIYIWKECVTLFCGNYEPVGDDQKVPFEEVPNIQAYVPMCFPSSNDLIGPLVAANCVNLKPKHYPDLVGKKFEAQNVALEFEQKELFGTVKGYLT